MENVAKMGVLAKVAKEFNEANITWAIGSSSSLYLRGIVDHFNDIDMFIGIEDIHRALDILNRLGTKQAEYYDQVNFGSEYFVEYVVDGLELDIIANFSIKTNGKEYKYPVEPYLDGEYILDGVSIPLTSVKMWQECYRLMGRTVKADLLDEYLGTKFEY